MQAFSRRFIFRCLRWAALLVWFPLSLLAAPVDTEVSDCKKQLKVIYDAIQNFRRAQKDLPNELGDLVPTYLEDAQLLICPAARRLGKSSEQISGVAGSRALRSTSYVYEFRPVPIPSQISGGSERTFREWKRLQMGLVGSAVPIVRCHSHAHSLNLSFGGEIYESPSDWEDRFADVVVVNDLNHTKLFVEHGQTKFIPIPMREKTAPAWLIDLSDHYNASLNRSWEGGDPGNSLCELPQGVVKLGDTTFDVRGMIQLAAGIHALAAYPPAVSNIVVGLACRRLTFLHAAAHSAPAGTTIGKYVIRFADGQHEDFPIIEARHVMDWWNDPEKPGRFDPLNSSRVAWKGTNPTRQREGKSVYLYQSRWENSRPGTKVTSIDFISTMKEAAPFLIGISADDSAASATGGK